jgi:hypothetical protein
MGPPLPVAPMSRYRAGCTTFTNTTCLDTMAHIRGKSSSMMTKQCPIDKAFAIQYTCINLSNSERMTPHSHRLSEVPVRFLVRTTRSPMIVHIGDLSIAPYS